jgi:hypothetical protein
MKHPVELINTESATMVCVVALNVKVLMSSLSLSLVSELPMLCVSSSQEEMAIAAKTTAAIYLNDFISLYKSFNT